MLCFILLFTIRIFLFSHFIQSLTFFFTLFDSLFLSFCLLFFCISLCIPFSFSPFHSCLFVPIFLFNQCTLFCFFIFFYSRPSYMLFSCHIHSFSFTSFPNTQLCILRFVQQTIRKLSKGIEFYVCQAPKT